jgi:hypothetical protein
MRTWQVSDDIRREPALADLVERSRSVLEGLISPFSKDAIEARWELVHAGSKPVLRLTLSDTGWPTSVQRATFDVGELASPEQSRRRFLVIWGDLLQAKSHEQLRRLLGESGAGDAA